MIRFLISTILTMSLIQLSAQELKFNGGHSHNDYHQAKPLFDALNHGMISIEADIFLRNEELLVGHSTSELTNSKTLESLYLRPLENLITEKQDQFQPIILLIDIKDRGERTYDKLKEYLQKYKNILTEYSDGKIIKRQVTIIISGDRPINVLRDEHFRYAFIDGRLNKNDINEDASLIPLISDNWNNYFSWKGNGEIDQNELKKLKNLVEECHKNNKIIRFWGIPSKPEIRQEFWEVLLNAGVDLIGCDFPSCLENYIINKR